ncbi:MAG: O-antigen ligase family protein [Thermoleophilaceae bacterium]|nr:O-antigen ligase family protein [Thermoleophilaceae bacterium]
MSGGQRFAFAASVAVAISAAAFATGGGQSITRTGPVLAVLLLLATAFVGRAAATDRLPHPFAGLTTILLMTALAAWSALSIGWSIVPGDSYVDAGRNLTYVAVFASAALAAQLMRGYHREMLAGLLGGCSVVIGYALVTRVFPSWFSTVDDFARLRAPLDYWNAVGLVAAIGFVLSLWLGTTRELKSKLIAVSYPLGAVFFVALLMSQSRGAIVATLLGGAVWVVLVPRRLRSVVWAALTVGLGGLACVWVFSQQALSQDNTPLPIRTDTGHKFALLLLTLIVVAYISGLLVERLRGTHYLEHRHRHEVGRVLLIALLLSPLLLFTALTATDRGAWGTVSNSVSDLVNPNIVAPGNTPARLTQTSSLRARYWRDAFEVWSDHKLRGTGADTFAAARLPYRKDVLKVRHAHGFVPQVMSDLGIVGLFLALALLIAWIISALKSLAAKWASPTHWLGDADDSQTALGALVVAALVYGAHSMIDWTWFVPGVTFIGLVAAGWVAGSARNREFLNSEAAGRQPGSSPRWLRYTLATGIGLIGISIMLSVYRPAQAARKVDAGFRYAASGHPYLALAAGREARKLDAISDGPQYLVAVAQNNLRQRRAAEITLEMAAAQQPGNPETWLHLADFRLNSLDDPEGAIAAVKPLLFLSPNSERGVALYRAAQSRRDEKRVEAKLKRDLKRLRALIRKQKRAAAKSGATGNAN